MNAAVMDLELNLSNQSNDSDIVCEPMLPITHDAALIFHACVLTVILFSTVLLNSLVLLLVCKYKRLQVRAIIIVVSLTAADLLLTFSYTFPSLVTVIAKRWLFTDSGCLAFGFLAYEFLTTRWLVMGVLCLDRFFTVRFPFKYPRYSKRILVTLVITAWLLPFLMSLPSLFTFGPGMLRETGPTCLPTCKRQSCQLFYTVCTSSTFFIGGVLSAVLYGWMYCQGRKKMAALQLGLSTSVDVAGGVAVRGSFSQYTMDARERRALGTFVLLLVTVLVTGVPSYTLALIRSLNVSFHCQIPLYIAFLITELLMSASALNPLVVMRDRDFRHCIKHLFCGGRAFSKTRDSYTSRDGTTSTTIRSSPKHNVDIVGVSVGIVPVQNISMNATTRSSSKQNDITIVEDGKHIDSVSNGMVSVTTTSINSLDRTDSL